MNQSGFMEAAVEIGGKEATYRKALFGVAPTSTRSTAGAGASNSSFASVRLKQLRLLYSMPKTAPLCPALYAAVSRAAPNRPKISQVSWQLDILMICLRFPQVTSSIICHFCSFYYVRECKVLLSDDNRKLQDKSLVGV